MTNAVARHSLGLLCRLLCLLNTNVAVGVTATANLWLLSYDGCSNTMAYVWLAGVKYDTMKAA